MRSRSNAPIGGAPKRSSRPATRTQKTYPLRRNNENGGRALVIGIAAVILLIMCASSVIPGALDFIIHFSSNEDSNANPNPNPKFLDEDDDTTASAASEAVVSSPRNNAVGRLGDVVTEVITVPIMLPQGVDIAQKGKSFNDNDNNNEKIPRKMNHQATLSTVRKLDLAELSNNHNHNHNRDRPLLLSGWQDAQNPTKMHQFSKIMEYDNFVSTFGNYTMYVKDEFAQPLKDKKNRKCIAPSSYNMKIMKSAEQNTLFFTNDMESPSFMRELTKLYTVPDPIDYHNDVSGSGGSSSSSGGFHVFSAMVQGSYHGFHFHDEAQIYQIHGRKIWWFLPPDTKRPGKVNPCKFLTGEEALPDDDPNYANALSVVQQPGDTILVPSGWWHATCALDEWTVAVGMQRGSPKQFDQDFEILPQPYVQKKGEETTTRDLNNQVIDEKLHPMPWKNPLEFHLRMIDCGVRFNWNNLDSWGWFNGDVNKYYNKLIASDSKRDPNNIKTYAVHRWLGKDRSTLVHYELILSMMKQFTSAEGLRVLDAGCGLGAGLMWFERHGPPSFQMIGHTLSSAQLDFINKKLPSHKFRAELKSYDDLGAYGGDSDSALDAIYSIEAFIHSTDENNTLKQWSRALADKGIIILIDDFITIGVDKNAEDIQVFKKSWMGNVLQTTSSLTEIAERHNLELVLDRDIGSEYQVNKFNYQNKKPGDMMPTKAKSHQGWLGSKMRQRLMIEGKLTYRLVVFQKKGGVTSHNIEKRNVDDGAVKKAKDFTEDDGSRCTAVQSRAEDDEPLGIEPIKSEHRTGRGAGGGGAQQCISGWYCCGMGEEWWNNLEENRTDNTSYLKLSKSLFGNYMDKIVENLNKFYETLPQGTKGKFLDIGGTGSVASGMTKVTSKFAHFSGPFDYWVLDSDPAAANLENAVYCDMADCPEAKSCEYDVTFSHTVLEHTPRPWEAFDTIARVTKKGGLSAHVVPFSYQYHATPDDNYRFSHKALISLMEDRGFTVLDVGYDICTKPEKVLREKVDEHFDTIWLTYVIAQKN